jgi:hypothetical protein
MTDQAPPLTRRQAITAGGAAALAAAAGPALAQTAATTIARGTVFEDTDGSRRRSPASRGIPGVMVSNGMDVVPTDAEGHWSLPVAAGDSLFVIKPTGWSTPIDPATQLPRFAYVHAPEGTPAAADFRFAGIAPTGPLPASIDFPLRRHDEAPRFSAILFTDPQPESLAEVGYIRDAVVAQTVDSPAAFGISHGDLMFDDLSFYDRYNHIVGSIGVPWFNCCGNHDMNYEAPDNTLSRETFKRVFGARYYAFQHGGATFFALDNVEYQGTETNHENGKGKYRGHFGERQLAFVRNVLAQVPKQDLVVFSFHIPLKTQLGSEPRIASVDARGFLEVIASHPNSVSFSGHTHTNEHWYLGAADGFSGGLHHHHVLAAVSGSWWSGPFDERGIPVALEIDGSPNGFHVLEVDGTRYRTTLVPANDPNRGQLRIVLDSQLHGSEREVMRDYHSGVLLRGPIERAAAPATRVVVNFFDGGPRSTVEMAIGGGAYAPMRRVARTDPFVVEVYARNTATKKPWVHPAVSTHVWQAGLPAGIEPGTHRVSVRATDEFGGRHEGWMVLEVTA